VRYGPYMGRSAPKGWCPYTYESGSRVRLGELDSGARLGYISPDTHEWMPLDTRTSLTHWNPSPAGLASQTGTVSVWAALVPQLGIGHCGHGYVAVRIISYT
jgi:hypothetical protein